MPKLSSAPPPAEADATPSPDEVTIEQFATEFKVAPAVAAHVAFLNKLAPSARFPVEQWQQLLAHALSARV